MNKEKKASIQFLIFVAKPAKCLFHLHIDEFTGELSFQIALDAGTAACSASYYKIRFFESEPGNEMIISKFKR